MRRKREYEDDECFEVNIFYKKIQMKKTIVSIIAVIAGITAQQPEARGQWVETSMRGQAGEIYCLLSSGDSLYAGADSGVFVSTNNGANWIAINNGISDLEVYALAAIGGRIFAGGWGAYENGSPGNLFFSTDNGANWICDTSLIPDNTIINSLAIKEGDLFVGTQGSGVFFSTNNGDSWALAGENWNVAGDGANHINVLSVDGGKIYAGTNYGVFLSTDNGANWVSRGLTDDTLLNIQALAASDGNLYAGTFKNDIFFSSNDGENWISIDNGTANMNLHFIAVSGENLFVGINGGVSLSTNNGANWFAEDSGLITDSQYGCLTVSNGNLFTVYNRWGIFRRPLSDFSVSAVRENPSAPSGQLSLAQNFPNPVFSSTTIMYSLPQAAPVSLRIYNTLGVDVAALADGLITAGAHTITFNNENLPEGIYFYRLECCGNVITKQMSVMK